MSKGALINDGLFVFKGKEYNLLNIIDINDFFGTEKYGKPIIKKYGIIKLIKFFGFVIVDHKIMYDNDHTLFEFKKFENSQPEKKSIGKTCSVIVTLADFSTLEIKHNSNEKQVATIPVHPILFQGEGEANFLNTSGLGQLYLQAIAKKRAVSRAVLDYLGIDAYGEDESYDFKNDAETIKAIKTFVADLIIEMAGALPKPLIGEELKNYVKNYLKLDASTKTSAISEEQLIATLFHIYEQLPPEAKNAYKQGP